MDAKFEHFLEINSHDGCRRITLNGATHSIGRRAKNSIVIDAPEISRQHAILLRIAVPNSNHYIFRIVDGNLKGQQSTNGVFINGVKQTSHILKHGDRIEFGGRTKVFYYRTLETESPTPHDDDEGGSDIDPFGTVLVEQSVTTTSVDAEMARLVSFLELSPHPIIELDLKGNITYLNPASSLEFPNLKQSGINHPILAGLVDLVINHRETSLLRDIDLGEQVYQQAIYYLPESRLIRLNMLDITHKKQAEAELVRRDKLLQAIAQATKILLVELTLDKAVKDALATLGQAANVDHIFICQHKLDDPISLSITVEFEWSSEPTTNLKALLLQHTEIPEGKDSGAWYALLSQGQAIQENYGAMSAKTTQYTEHSQLRSILLVPLFLREQYWGFIGVADDQPERQWSIHEESSLFTLAASISAALNRQQNEQKMRHRALYDALTELPNRTLFDEQLDFCLKNARRNGHQLAVMFLDLDRFKAINDTLGHTIGDQLLKHAATRISRSLREGDLVARWGGDEFTVLLPHIHSVIEAADIAERILKALEVAFELESHELYVTGSIGISILDDNSHDAESLIKHADIALYQAKEKGRNAYEIYDHSLNSKSPEVLTLEKDLRRALLREEFLVYYQPRINLSDGSISGAEALIRWQHPSLGLVSPSVFIPLAEENGLIIPIGEWVLRQACLQNKRWQEAGICSMTVAVNLSPRQFRQPNLLQRVAEILEETDLEPQYLELEITESNAIQDIEFTTRVLESLHDMGVKVSVDDFGTGHSSLNRLQCLPFDNLKIDQSFIRDLVPNTKVSHIVSTIVSLGQKLGLHIVAEGVEEHEQLDFLKSIQCDTVQGYIFYKPISAIEMQSVLQSQGKDTSTTPDSATPMPV